MNIVKQPAIKNETQTIRPLSVDEVCALEKCSPPLLTIGNRIVWLSDNGPEFGYIKWLGKLPDVGPDWMAGVHFDNPVGSGTGIYNDYQLFDAPVYHASLVPVIGLLRAEDFTGDPPPSSALSSSLVAAVITNNIGNENSSSSSNRNNTISDRSKQYDASRITCDIPPLSTHDDLKYLCGKARGIQGHHNSCYLDATLFAMFSYTTIFESLLHRPQSSSDIAEYSEVQKVLKEEIVNPLRANLYVSADRVMHLRTLLEKLTSVRGLTSEEKDPEEFLNLLLNQILKADPYLKLSSGLESYFYQLFVDKDEKLVLPTVQQLFDQSFLASDFKLREIPPCLLLQMPRFGRQFKMYPRIVPSLYLDISDVLDNSPRQCSICGELAEFECKECFGQFGEGLDSTAFCQKCLDKSHAHKKRAKHKTTKLNIPTEFILCIETSHYVAFVKCGSGPDAPWCFFDSMADRNGEQDGYNIPEVTLFQNLRWWLSDEGTALLLTTKDDKLLPEMTRRLLCDAYMCMYQSPDLMMYR
uniref:ubiquitinyl hydrolase 1 n=1 Tax=Tetranychus urticae TaxID=32264 RepID=T1KJA6_TETUR